jgi:integrase/recombinase XerC
MTLPTQPQTNRAVEPSQARARRGAFEQPIGYLADQYLALKARRWRPLTCDVNRSHILRFCEWLEERDVGLAGKVSPELITAYGLEWHAAELKHLYKAATVNNHLNAVRGFLIWLVNEVAVFERTPEGLPWVTETRIRQYLSDVPDTSRPTRKQNAPSDDEMRRLLAVMSDPRDRAFFTLLAGSGLRVSECCALRAGEVEIREDGAGIVHVIEGKGGKSRKVVVAGSIVGVVYAWAISAGLRLGDPSDKRKLWPPKHGEEGRGITRVRAYQLLAQYAEAAKIGRKITPHHLRHFYGTERYRAERDPVAVAEALGHTGLDYVQTYVKQVEAHEAKPFDPELE